LEREENLSKSSLFLFLPKSSPSLWEGEDIGEGGFSSNPPPPFGRGRI